MRDAIDQDGTYVCLFRFTKCLQEETSVTNYNDCNRSALIQINSKCVLSVRVFINRNKVLKSITNSDTIFEAPILSNNSIIRLKTPAIRLHLSNEDMKFLLNEIRDSLLFMLYELCSPILEEKVLNKLKIDTFMDFADILEILKKGSSLETRSTDVYNPIDGIDVHITSIERTGKKSYKLHFSHNWRLDILIENIDKLHHWRKLLTLLDSVQSVSNTGQSIPLFIPFKSTNVLVRSIKPLESDTNSSKSEDPPILIEPEDDGLGQVPRDEIEMVDQDPNDIKLDTKDDKKPIFDYQYKGMRLFDKCIKIHVLGRPKRGKKN